MHDKRLQKAVHIGSSPRRHVELKALIMEHIDSDHGRRAPVEKPLRRSAKGGTMHDKRPRKAVHVGSSPRRHVELKALIMEHIDSDHGRRGACRKAAAAETRGMEAVRGAGRPKKSRHAQAQATEVPGRAARLPGPVKVTLLKRKARPWERRKIDREIPEQSVSSSSGESVSSSDEDRQPGRTARARRAASEDIRQARAEGSSTAGRQAERDIQSESRGQVGQQVDWRALGKTLAAKHGDKATSLRGTLESNAASDPGAIVALRIEEFLGSEDGRQLFVGRCKELMAIGLVDALEQFVLASRAGSLRWTHKSLEARLRRGLTPLIEEIADLLAAAFRTAAGTYPGASPDFGGKCTVPQLMTTACQKASDAVRVPDVQEWSQRMAEALCAPGWGAAVVEECEKIQPQLPVEGILLWRVFLAALRSKFSCSDTGAQFSAQELRRGLFPAAVSLVRLTIAAKAALAETELIAVDKHRDGAREQYTRPRYTPSLPGGEGPQSFGGMYRVPSGTQWPVAGQEAAQAHQARRPEPVVSPSKRRKLNEPSAGSAGAGPSGTLPAMRPATRLPQPSPRTSPSTSQQSVEIVASPLQFVTSTLCASRLKSLYPKCNKLTSQLGSESIQTIFENGKFENQLVRP
ncbi:hypothetical protein VOLCADRAFT_107915 [Volvox carteri f. nagariensis]|uniref:Uncharacterized protein n=1 Tax=Volvox carteri f. nagariensis TaxID=3068 RepID=D8UH70_VOLCA|nr:uncharacterized protein VOLCADRAFT_107915 [Volvox carteri f. nagariensis]EFJ40949.1 hypothetical protein VOLCADRAFT_107915 [Volvox carteri f. nagariensis]|eukprot:XP_002958016.1 hypothetical protein VOLCADRAFT_107915 [Volvox carteri f. nagariensis]